MAQGLHTHAIFAGGAFYIDQAASADGQAWQALPDLYPLAAVNDDVLGRSGTAALATWRLDQTARPMTSVRYIDTLTDGDRSVRMRWNGAVEPNELSAENFPNHSPLPEQIEFPLSGDSDCSTAACVVVGERLYLVSPSP